MSFGLDPDDGHGSYKYTQKAYWDTRFEEENEYEWLSGWEGIAALVSQYISESDRATLRVLLVGNGTSRLPMEMASAGFRHITATDYSPVCVRRMRVMCAGTPVATSITWAVADMTDLCTREEEGTAGSADRGQAHGQGTWPGTDREASGSAAEEPTVRFPPASFDVVIDKAAMDAILAHGADVWQPPDDLMTTAGQVMRGMAGVLKPGGLFLQLSFSQPHFRKAYLLQRPVMLAGRSLATYDKGDASSTSDHDRATGAEQSAAPVAQDADEEDEWEPDSAPHLTPVYPTGAGASADAPDGDSAAEGSGPGGSTELLPASSPWTSATTHTVPVGFGYFLYVLRKRG